MSALPKSPALLPAALAAALLTGCFSDNPAGESANKTRVKTELLRSRSEAAPPLPKAAVSAAEKPHWTSNVKVLSYRAPLMEIAVRNEDRSLNSGVYHCSGPQDSCLVELNGPALEDLLGAAPVSIRTGTYGWVYFRSCGKTDSGYTAYVTAEATLDGVVHYTHPDSVLTATGPAQPVAIRYGGCGTDYALPSPLEVTDTAGAEIPFRLFFDIQDLVWAGLNEREAGSAWAPGNCAGPDPRSDVPGSPFLCAGYPDIAGTTDLAEPKLERYYINGGAIVGLFHSGSNGRFIGGYSRRFLKEGALNLAGFEAVTPIKAFESNGDGTYTLETWGGMDMIPAFRTTGFRREAHSATYAAGGVDKGVYEATLARP